MPEEESEPVTIGLQSGVRSARCPCLDENPIVRRVSCLFVLVLVLAGCGAKDLGSIGQTGSNASCVGPHLDDQPPDGTYGAKPPRVRPGASLTIYGHWYTNTCQDTGVNGRRGNAPLDPLPPVRLTLTLPGGRVQHLGTYTPAGPDAGFTATVHIPRNARTGTATIGDNRQDTRNYSFRIGEP